MHTEYNLKALIEETPEHTFEDDFHAKQMVFPKISGSIDGIGEFKGWPVVRLADNRILVFGPHVVADLIESSSESK